MPIGQSMKAVEAIATAAGAIKHELMAPTGVCEIIITTDQKYPEREGVV